MKASMNLYRGSPPHTRGKVDGLLQESLEVGITPAHAGKSKQFYILPQVSRDHPRTRGEKPVQQNIAGVNLGSPPHTRGKDVLRRRNLRKHRITPAHAGKSRTPWRRRNLHRDHPRTRGEKDAVHLVAQGVQGSPPHTRGKGNARRNHIYFFGITPAHAGKSKMKCKTKKDAMGSPPHTRGKGRTRTGSPSPLGITPAHAGKRSK